jgi:hypothetical protein
LHFFHIVHILSLFDLPFFHIFHIFSLFNLPFFHNFHIFSLFNLRTFLLYFPYLFTIQLGFLPYFFTIHPISDQTSPVRLPLEGVGCAIGSAQ